MIVICNEKEAIQCPVYIFTTKSPTLQQSANAFHPCGIALHSSVHIVTQSTILAISTHEHVYRIGTGIILAFDNKSSQITTYIL